MNLSASKNDKQLKIAEKIISDLEDLSKKLVEQYQNDSIPIKDDSYELQKFCSKLEYLIQLNLKEKKTGVIGSGSTQNTHSLQSESNLNKDYWNFILDQLKSSRSFEDAIKYVKNLNEIKTNLGRARAFMRFCLQYHRLADAVQQLYMEDNVVSHWYNQNSVWLNQTQKSLIIQLLYDLSEINFELIARNNFELDTTWPSIQLNNKARNRTYSITSHTSLSIDRDKDQTDTSSILLGSTPLEMEDEFLYHQNLNPPKINLNQDQMSQSIYYDTSNINIENYEKKIEDLMSQVTMKDQNEQKIKKLELELFEKNKQYQDLNSCLIKQSNLCENLSDLLKKSEEKQNELNLTIQNLINERDALKFELSSKTLLEEKLKKEVFAQTESINMLKQSSLEQDKIIKELKSELGLALRERTNEVESQLNEAQRNKIALQLKEEEIFLLNDQTQRLTRQLEEEKEQNLYLTNELNEIKCFYKDLNDKNSSLIKQLEADNNEIKKRLSYSNSFNREKAELWQKADNLEYENLLKTNSMWVDDANVHNCMNCNSAFGLLLRKHHCRICLKIFCYYCCNDWIDYNNSKLRVCKKCHDTRENVNKVKLILNEEKPAEITNNQSEEEDDPDTNFEVRPEKLNMASDQSGDDSFSNIYDQKNTELSSILDTKVNDQGYIEESESEEFEKDTENNTKKNEPTSSKLLSKFTNKFEFKYFSSNHSQTFKEDENEPDLVIRRKKTKKKTNNKKVTNKSTDDLDTFAIVSQEEIDKIKN